MNIQQGGDDVSSEGAKMFTFPALGCLTGDVLFLTDYDRFSSVCFVLVCRYPSLSKYLLCTSVLFTVDCFLKTSIV